MRTLHVEVTSVVESREEFAALAVKWLSAARDLAFPGFDEAMDRDGWVPFDPPDPQYGDWLLGQPTPLLGGIHLQRKPGFHLDSHAKYSLRSWRRLVDGLESAYPYQIIVGFEMYDDEGKKAGRARSASFAVGREFDPDVVRFDANMPDDIVGWTGSAELLQAWAVFARGWASEVGTCYGHVTDDASLSGTALERALHRWPGETVPRCREVLRGYSWVTICPAELAARLGGAGKLAATGAFCEVSEGAGGSVFLRATPTLEDYDQAAARKVFEALAPVLLTGRVEAEGTEGGASRVILGVDAADYQEERR
jgi:hypothetical protein